MPSTEYFASQARVVLPGSEKANVSTLPPTVKAHAAKDTKPAAPPKRFTVTVLLRRKQEIKASALTDRSQRISRLQFGSRYGAASASVRLVEAFAAEFGLEAVPHEDAGRRTVSVTGTESQMQKAFGVTLRHEQVGPHTYRVREGSITLPQELQGHVVGVLGLDNRPQAKPHSRAAVPHASNVSYTPVQVAGLYNFPAGATAAKQTIGIIELGGGFSAADLGSYFNGLGLPVPNVVAVPVDGGSNSPGTDTNSDAEVMLDIEVCAAVAPGAKIAVYFAPNTDQGFIDAVAAAVHDTSNKPGVISISWGGPESSWTAQSYAALDAACQSAAVLGVTITVACGDNGSTDGVTDGENHVDFPASSPHVLACGGTKLIAKGNAIASEVVWNELKNNEGATGGGVSNLFPLPAWQANANVPASTATGGGRGLPDVSGDADPATGYQILVDGQQEVIGGTSAVAPLWAGLIALANQANGGTAGFVNPVLYGSSAASALRDITSGNNPGFKAGPGWDACSGLGSPDGTLIIAALAPAGATPAPTPKPTPKPPKKPKKPKPKKPTKGKS